MMKKRLITLMVCGILAVSAGGCDSSNTNTQGNTEQPGNSDVVDDTSDGNTNKVTDTTTDYDVMECVTLGEYKGLPVTLTETYEVTDQDFIDYVNDTLIASTPYLFDTDKEVLEEGDYANLDYEGIQDGEAFTGGTGSDFDLLIGSDTFIPGFEEGMIGMKVGEKRDLNLTFPETYQVDSLAGQEVVFHVTLNAILEAHEMSYELFDDAYATYYSQENGMDYTDAETLLTDVRSYLEGTAQNERSAAIYQQILPQLLECCTVELPDGLLEKEITKTEDTYMTGYATMYQTLEDIAKNVFMMSLEEFEAKIADDTESNLKIEMILEAIAIQENIETDETAFANYVSRLMSQNEFQDEESLYLNYGETAEEGQEVVRKNYLRVQALNLLIDESDVTISESTEELATE